MSETKEWEWIAVESTTPGQSDVLEGGQGGYSVIGSGFISSVAAKEIAERHNAALEKKEAVTRNTTDTLRLNWLERQTANHRNMFAFGHALTSNGIQLRKNNPESTFREAIDAEMGREAPILSEHDGQPESVKSA